MVKDANRPPESTGLMSGYNSKQIVLRALQGQTNPSVATGPLAVHFCAAAAGQSLRDYTLNPRVLADCVLRYYERFRPDAVWVSADTWVTAQAMGKPVAFPGPGQPLAGTPGALVRTLADVARIPPPDPWKQGRCPLMLEALGRVVEVLGNDVFVVACFDQYPFDLACQLMGMEALMLALVDNRPLVDALVDRSAEYTLAYASALAAVGADMLSGGDSIAGLIGPRLYREVALPAEQRVIAGVKSHASLPVSLHICGNATPILADMARAGADVLELDHQVDMATACRIVPADTALWGNLDPVGVLARGSTADVCAATDRLLRTVEAQGRRRFVLSSGCTLAVDTPPENLAAMLGQARHWPQCKSQP
jgi:MtaA/CmuA family methyltransferase